jgi:hypothetical protein
MSYITVCVRANLTAKRPITKSAQGKEKQGNLYTKGGGGGGGGITFCRFKR